MRVFVDCLQLPAHTLTSKYNLYVCCASSVLWRACDRANIARQEHESCITIPRTSGDGGASFEHYARGKSTRSAGDSYALRDGVRYVLFAC